jgi:hypothetical protein
MAWMNRSEVGATSPGGLDIPGTRDLTRGLDMTGSGRTVTESTLT